LKIENGKFACGNGNFACGNGKFACGKIFRFQFSVFNLE